MARSRAPEQLLSGHFLTTKKRLEELIHQRSAPAGRGRDEPPSAAA